MKKIIWRVLASAFGAAALAAPRVPKTDREVLERLPTRRGDPASCAPY